MFGFANVKQVDATASHVDVVVHAFCSCTRGSCIDHFHVMKFLDPRVSVSLSPLLLLLLLVMLLCTNVFGTACLLHALVCVGKR